MLRNSRAVGMRRLGGRRLLNVSRRKRSPEVLVIESSTIEQIDNLANDWATRRHADPTARDAARGLMLDAYLAIARDAPHSAPQMRGYEPVSASLLASTKETA